MGSILRRVAATVEERFLVPVYSSAHPAPWIAAHAALALPLLLRGKAQRYLGWAQGETIEVLCVGREKRFSALLKRLFEKITPVGEAEARGLWSPGQVPHASADLIATEVHRWAAPRFRSAGWRIIPESVRWKGSLQNIPPAMPSKSLRSDLKRVRDSGYTLEMAGARVDWDEFFNEFVIPHANSRFGMEAWLPSPSLQRRFISAGALLFVRSGGDRVAGICLVNAGQRAAWAPVLGVRGGARHLIEAGAIPATYALSLQWARERGVQHIDFGRTSPFIRDGLVRYKRKWGFVPCQDPLAHRLAVWMAPGCTALGEVLRRDPVLVEEEDGFAELRG